MKETKVPFFMLVTEYTTFRNLDIRVIECKFPYSVHKQCA